MLIPAAFVAGLLTSATTSLGCVTPTDTITLTTLAPERSVVALVEDCWLVHRDYLRAERRLTWDIERGDVLAVEQDRVELAVLGEHLRECEDLPLARIVVHL